MSQRLTVLATSSKPANALSYVRPYDLEVVASWGRTSGGQHTTRAEAGVGPLGARGLFVPPLVIASWSRLCQALTAPRNELAHLVVFQDGCV